MYVLYNIDVLSFNHCCSRKAVSTTYSVYVFEALGIQHAMRIHIVICGLSDPTIFFQHCLINGRIPPPPQKKRNIRVLMFSAAFVCNI
jgi:hypothetical protein